jgi:hypothetical protein
MTTRADADQRRVRRLLRWYPPSWRARYGDEFAELLLSEFGEQPRSWRRTGNVAGCGLLARLTCAGLTSHELPPAERVRAGLATFGCALAVFLAFSLAMLAQLATGWQWASPGSASVAAGTLVMAVAAASLVLIGLAAIIPVGWYAAAAAFRRRDARLAWPAAAASASAAMLAAGASHFQNAWPGSGGIGAEHRLVPGGVAAFGWASTLSVSSYWAHPALLQRFPLPELSWMALSPAVATALVTASVMVLRRLALPYRVLRYQALLAAGASAVAITFLAGAASWVLGDGPRQAGLFRPGLVDGAELLIMALALAVALRAAVGIWHARPALPRPDQAARQGTAGRPGAAGASSR